MSPFRVTMFAAACALTMGAGTYVHAADRTTDDDRPGVRHCTNDPDLASDLYEYLQDCPAAQGVLNRSGAWVAVERDADGTPGAAGRAGDVNRPSAPDGTSMGSPSAPSTGNGVGDPPGAPARPD
ncbi:hypothetical protein [Emcibacter sp. SYSU 3D8]|uniref:hypothetical protein n=1 Tax=Emcibacter sp. SYSU 3D8 TaxID=3133969 RepID=UPI0031FF2B53